MGDPEGPGPGMLGKPGCKWFRFGFGRSILAGTENGSVIGMGMDGTVMAVGIAGGGWIGADGAVDVKAGLTAGIIGIVGGGYAGGSGSQRLRRKRTSQELRLRGSGSDQVRGRGDRDLDRLAGCKGGDHIHLRRIGDAL